MKKRLKYALLCGALLLLGGGVALGLRFYSGIARDPMRAFTEPSPSPSPLQAGQPLPSPTLSPEEQELDNLKSQLIQQRAIYAPTSPQIRLLEARIKALLKHFGSVAALSRASADEITALPGIGPKLAAAIEQRLASR